MHSMKSEILAISCGCGILCSCMSGENTESYAERYGEQNTIQTAQVTTLPTPIPTPATQQSTKVTYLNNITYLKNPNQIPVQVNNPFDVTRFPALSQNYSQLNSTAITPNAVSNSSIGGNNKSSGYNFSDIAQY